MEPFVVSARKFRPKNFKDVVGQSSITDTLENAISKNHLASALLFCGPRGVGKTTCARILAKKINSTAATSQTEDFAFNIFELDAASNNSVEDIRSLIDQVRIPPQQGTYKVYIIDEVHMLSQSAFNAFLKTLEEPPAHAIFILATTEKHKIIPTILSRCQIYDFKRITVKDAVNHLSYIAQQQGIEADEDALHIIAQKADGAMRDALSIFDRIVSFSPDKLTKVVVTENLNVLDYQSYIDFTELILKGAIPDLMLAFDDLLNKGFDGHHFISGLASHFRDLMICQYQSTSSLLEISDQGKELYQQQSKVVSRTFLIDAIDLANECDLNYKTSKNKRLYVELCLMKLATLALSGEKKKPLVKIGLLPTAYFKAAAQQQNIEEKELQTPVQNVDSNSLNNSTEVVVNRFVKNEDDNITSRESYLKDNNPAIDKESVATNQTITTPKINIVPKNVSAFSLSSIQKKKEHQEALNAIVHKEEVFPEDSFEESKMQELWAQYIEEIEAKGQKILASNLNSDVPKLLKDHKIWIELPNDTMKKEIERAQSGVLNFLKKELNNYSIHLKITVSEEVAKQFAFTPEEKYEKLREKNSNVDLLRATLDLDIT